VEGRRCISSTERGGIHKNHKKKAEMKELLCMPYKDTWQTLQRGLPNDFGHTVVNSPVSGAEA
jgi:hypothetical protein